MDNPQANNENLDFNKVWLMFKETEARFKETDKQLKEMFQETDKKFQETAKELKQNSIRTDKKLNKLEHLFTSQWGKLMEALVEGDLIKLLNAKGIQVYSTATRVKGFRNNREFEFDIIAENGEEIVVVEVKTTLRPDDVKEFLEELENFKSLLPKYKENQVIGAIAYLTEDGDSSKMAQKKGLFVIRATGSSASIINSEDFTPKYW